MTDRRQFLKGAAAALVLGTGAKRFQPQAANRVSVVKAGEANLVALSSTDGFVLVDSGAPQFLDQLLSALNGARVHTLFNTHYHSDQTGNNERCGAAGAKIIAHERARQWMSTDYWIPAEDRYEKARPPAARPTVVFQTAGSIDANGERIDYGYLPMAHTNGDIYVFFKTSNVLAVGDVASPLRDPALDYFTGAWIGGRVDAMDTVLRLADEQTRIVPSYGSVMTRAEFKAERDMMEEARARLWKLVREGLGPQEMLEAGAMNGLARTWQNPEKFLYDATKGMWAHHSKIDANVV